MEPLFPNDTDEAELAAELIFEETSAFDRAYEIDSQGSISFLQNSTEDFLQIDGIVRSLHTTLVREIREKELSKAVVGGVWGKEDEASRKRWISAYYDFVNSETRKLLADVCYLQGYVWELKQDDTWHNYIFFQKANEILWRHAVDDPSAIDRISRAADHYSKIPFRDKVFETNLLRYFFYVFTNSACSKFIDSYLQPYFLCHSAAVGDFRRFIAIEGLQILNRSEYSKRSKWFPHLDAISYAAFSVLRLASLILPFWYLDFPSYTERQFYLSLFLGVYLAYRLGATYDKATRKRRRKENKIKRKLVDLSQKLSLFISFSIENKPIWIDETPVKGMTKIKLGRETLVIPPAIATIFTRARSEGDKSYGDVKNTLKPLVEAKTNRYGAS